MKKKRPGPPKGHKHTDVKRTAFGQRLFDTRKARGISQQELGNRIGLSKRVICAYEGQAAGPPVETLLKLADELGVTASYLIGESKFKIVREDLPPMLKEDIELLKKLPVGDQRSVSKMIRALTLKNEVENKGE
jgi:transcriptional regulator with XRE-family HTH domain